MLAVKPTAPKQTPQADAPGGTEPQSSESKKPGGKHRRGQDRAIPSATGSARDRACAFIAHHAHRFPAFDSIELNTSGLEGRDAALGHAIVDAVSRRWLTLVYLIGLKCDRPWHALEPKIKGAMLVGAAQLLLLDRIPPYAAIDHAVGWVKQSVRPGAGGFVNAVLRRIAEMRGATRETQPASALTLWADRCALPLSGNRTLELLNARLPDDEIEALAVATGNPRQLIDCWIAQFGRDRTLSLALAGLAPAPLILNARYIGDSHVLDGLTRPHASRGFVIFDGPYESATALFDTRPDLWAQDPSSAGAVESLVPERGSPPIAAPRTIIDACAGKGTKTRQLAALFPRAEIVATDTDESRLAVLTRTFRGHPRVRVVPHAMLMPDLAGWADLVVLDVPCSNTGVLARRPQARHRFNRGSIEQLCDIQRQIIANSIPLLSNAKGGAILYATCSLDERENGAIAAWAVQWHGFERRAERTVLPAGASAASKDYRDGAYSIVLARGVDRVPIK